MSEEWGRIAVYDPSMAAQVAEMFNDFDALWPGTFTGGILYDAQRVHDWLDKSSAIADFIALDTDGDPVGYCGLYPHRRDKNACYVTILGVRPRVKGKKFGRRLLQTAVKMAREKGMTRLDLNTWSGNMNAVPLYKKIGLFWVPETSVYMQNYIPALAQIPLSKEWFDRHPDWYGCFQRELVQAPDKHIVDGMELYTYRFQVGDDRLVGEADRYGWGICGLERVLDGQSITIKTRLQSHDILIGIPNAMTVNIDNHTGGELSIALDVEPFKGMRWLEASFPPSLTVQDGETVSLTREFILDETVEIHQGEASETIKSRIIMNGQVIDLVTGGKIQPAVALSNHKAFKIAPLGGETIVYFDLRNYTGLALKGRVDVFIEGMPGSRQAIDFALESKEVSGIAVPISVPGDIPVLGDSASPVLTVHATPLIEVDGKPSLMPTYHFPVVVDHRDLAVVVKNNKGDNLHLLTDVVDVQVDLTGGDIQMGRRSLPDIRKRVRFQAGPPFGLSLDRSLKFDYQVIREGKTLTLILSADSVQFSGLQIRKCVRVTSGSREIEHWVTLVNLSPTSTHSVGGQLHTGGGGELSLNPFSEVSRSFTPLDGTIVECDNQLSFMNDNMVPQTPEHWPETWTAAQSLVNNVLVAWLWKADGVTKIEIGQGMLSGLESETRSLNPGDEFQVFHIWYGFGFSSLPDVRCRWNQLVGLKEMSFTELAYSSPTIPPIQASLQGDNIVLAGETVKRTVELSFVTPYPLPGELSLCLPAGWHGAFLTADGPQSTMPMPEPVPGTPSIFEVKLTVPAEPEAAALVQLCFSGEYEMCFDLPVLLARRAKVSIEEQDIEGHKVLAVSNDVIQFSVLAEQGGNLIRLQDDHGRTFLADTYPDIVPLFFVDHHIGGIQPILFDRGSGLHIKEPESVTAEIIQDGAWKGVRASWTIENLETLKGQEYSMTYLTLPGSSIVRIKLAHHNPTPRQLDWVGLLFANLMLHGSLDDTVFQAPGGTRAWTRNRAPKPFFGLTNLTEPWARLSKGDQSLIVLAVKKTHTTTMLADFQQLICGLLAGVPRTEPYGSSEIEFALVVNQPETQVGVILEALDQQ